MKRVELHLHLDGSLDVEYATKLVGRDATKDMVSKNDKSLKEYLEKFNLPGKLLSEYDDIVEFAYLLGKSLENDGVIYAEIRFCPLFHNKKISVDRVITGIRVGLAKVPTVKTNLIFCMMRHFSLQENLEILNLAKKYWNYGCCGVDLAGDEAAFRTESFKTLFEKVRQSNIPYTIHAGEADGASSVWAAVRFGAKRIGHGFKSIQDEALIKEIVDKKIVLEICPKSNLDTGNVLKITEHPIKDLVAAGVKVCINTDNRTVSETSLSNEETLLHEAFGWGEKEFLEFNLNAIEAAFLSEEEKQELRKKLVN